MQSFPRELFLVKATKLERSFREAEVIIVSS